VRAQRARDVTADGMTRVAAVVAALVESAAATAPDNTVSLTDLIAKAAKEMDHHGTATRAQRNRSLAQREGANESLAAAKRNAVAAPVRKLDIVR
jgi:hypothetical protein